MERSSSQILFNYLPGKTFDHETYRAVCRVDRVEGNRLERLDRATVLARVNAHIEAAAAAGNSVANFDERTRRDPEAWTIRRPTQVIARVFPLLLQCRLGCKRVFALNEDGSGSRLRKCPVCKKRLAQIQHILFHECGTLRSLEVPSCQRHGRGNIALDDRGSLTTADWRWVCRADGCNQTISRPLTRRCDCGTYPGTSLRPDLFRSSHVFRPLKVQIIDFPAKERRLFVEGPNASAAALIALIGVGEDVMMAQDEVQTQEEAMSALAKSLEKDNPTLAKQLREELERKKAAAGNLRDHAKRFFEESLHSIVAAHVLDFVVARRGVGFVSWQDKVTDAAMRQVIERSLSAIGVESLMFSPRFPTSTVVYAYSRGGSDTGQAAVIGFGREGEKHVAFGSENESDAVLVQLSPQRLLGCIGIEEPDGTRARARLATLIATEEPGAETVRTIVHTFAHAFAKAVGEWSGLDSSSLAEYLFPAAGAFAIYELVGTGISMGGIERMVQRHLRSVVDSFVSIVSSCMYDPACSERKGACFACVHLAEVSCQIFNAELDRRTLIGENSYLRERIPAGT